MPKEMEILPAGDQALKCTTSPSLIQESPELPTPLIATVDDLREENEQLRTENASLLSRFKRLQDQVSAFWRFPQLPFEIRRMIWNEALTTPQIHLMDYKKISLSRINVIMQSCKEARQLGLLLQLQYYYLDIDENLDDSSPKYYINLEIDTIWLPRDQYIPEFVDFYCCICPGGAIFPMRGRPDTVCSHKTRLRRIAMPNSCWREPSRVGFSENGGLILRQCNSVQELYIAVGDTEDAMNGEVGFCEPTERFRPYDSWEEAAFEVESSLREWRERQIQHNSGSDYDSDGIDDEDELNAYLAWKIPKVRYVGMAVNSGAPCIRPGRAHASRYSANALAFGRLTV